MLDLTSNKINDKGWVGLAEVLKENKTVETLLMNGNIVGDKGCATFAEVLQKNHSLKNLGLGTKYFDNTGFRAFMDVLKENQVLKALFLSAMSIDDKFCVALGEVLKKNKVLTALSINGKDKSSTKGRVAVIEGLQANRSITVFEHPWRGDKSIQSELDLNNQIYAELERKKNLEQVARELRCIHAVNRTLAMPLAGKRGKQIVQSSLTSNTTNVGGKQQCLDEQKLEVGRLEAANSVLTASLGLLGTYLC
mmetsp:Transcript_10737/g.17495  ORF Transcript_10737/g.17495 Transcript_10737/m.17495 type:complete len:251 (+) Transcript_10737:269-1021(+)